MDEARDRSICPKPPSTMGRHPWKRDTFELHYRRTPVAFGTPRELTLLGLLQGSSIVLPTLGQIAVPGFATAALLCSPS